MILNGEQQGQVFHMARYSDHAVNKIINLKPLRIECVSFWMFMYLAIRVTTLSTCTLLASHLPQRKNVYPGTRTECSLPSLPSYRLLLTWSQSPYSVHGLSSLVDFYWSQSPLCRLLALTLPSKRVIDTKSMLMTADSASQNTSSPLNIDLCTQMRDRVETMKVGDPASVCPPTPTGVSLLHTQNKALRHTIEIADEQDQDVLILRSKWLQLGVVLERELLDRELLDNPDMISGESQINVRPRAKESIMTSKTFERNLAADLPCLRLDALQLNYMLARRNRSRRMKRFLSTEIRNGFKWWYGISLHHVSLLQGRFYGPFRLQLDIPHNGKDERDT